MSVLTIAQAAAKRLQINAPASIISATDGNVILLVQMLEKAAADLRDMHPWPELIREFTFTLATDTAYYNLPGDFNGNLSETLWNRTQHYPLIGPVDSVEWQNYKSGLITTLPRQRFKVRVKNYTNSIFLDPTPTSSENGQTCALEYVSSYGLRPQTWRASTAWTGEQYCSYDGSIYNRGGTGVATTGTTPPTHVSGTTVSDGSISWTHSILPYESIVSNSDEVAVDNQLVTDAIVWMFKRERGFAYEELRKEWMEAVDVHKGRIAGAGVMSINRSHKLPSMIGPWSYPEGSYGL
jgi:hypothetical protein